MKDKMLFLNFVIWTSTFIAIKDIFLFSYFIVSYLHNLQLTYLFLAIVNLILSFTFLYFRNRSVKEKKELV